MISPYRKKENKKTRPLLSRLFLMVFLLSLAFLLLNLDIKIVKKKIVLEKEAANLKERLEEARKEREKLLIQIASPKNPYFLEKTAREYLDLKKEGEKVVAFPIIKQNSLSSSSSEELKQKGESGESNFFFKLLKKLGVRK
jgi:cell division protein FtsB